MINIYKDYYIGADANNFTLFKKTLSRKRATGEEYYSFEALAWFTTLNGAYAYFVKEVERGILSEEKVITIGEFIERMDVVIAELNNTIKSFERLGKSFHVTQEAYNGLKEMLDSTKDAELEEEEE